MLERTAWRVQGSCRRVQLRQWRGRRERRERRQHIGLARSVCRRSPVAGRRTPARRSNHAPAGGRSPRASGGPESVVQRRTIRRRGTQRPASGCGGQVGWISAATGGGVGVVGHDTLQIGRCSGVGARLCRIVSRRRCVSTRRSACGGRRQSGLRGWLPTGASRRGSDVGQDGRSRLATIGRSPTVARLVAQRSWHRLLHGRPEGSGRAGHAGVRLAQSQGAGGRSPGRRRLGGEPRRCAGGTRPNSGGARAHYSFRESARARRWRGASRPGHSAL